jgi:hypothetical protein
VQVYVFEKFQVRVANKQYSSVRNDYEIQFTDKWVKERFSDDL